MKLDNKGFVVSTLMYSLLVVFLFLIIGLMTLLSDRKMILDKLKKDVKSDINGMAKFDYYPNGTAIYYNPITNQKCNDYVEANSLNENKEGCLKWYSYNDNVNKNKVNLILDHNTTNKIAYNLDGSNSEIKEADEEMRNLVNTNYWQVTPRFITADEIALLVGASRDDKIKWSSNKPYSDSPTDISTQSSWFYLDGKGNTYSSSNGWQKLSVSSTNRSKYEWLFDYSNCSNYGCAHPSNLTEGYWTSSPIIGSETHIWVMDSSGYYVGIRNADAANLFGIRPVITLDKKVLK